MFCPTKDKIPVQQRANLIYQIDCPGCGESYIGKTDRCVETRMLEHGTRNTQPMFRHLSDCHLFHDYVNLFSLPTSLNTSYHINVKEHIKNAVLNNYSIIDDFRGNWSQLCYLEAYYIKRFSPYINKGLKASKELQLFT